MADLSVNYCGVTYRNPLISASAAQGWDGIALKTAAEAGAGGVVPKTLGPEVSWAAHPRNGRMYVYKVGKEPVGMLDLELFTTKSRKDWFDKELAIAKEGGAVMHISILAMPDPADTAAYAKQLLDTGLVDLFEINVSCPMPADTVGMHIGKNPELAAAQVRAVKAIADVPVTIKLTPNVSDIVEIAKAVKEAGADGITIGNSLRGFAGADIETGHAIQRAYCGYGGPAVKPVIMAMVTDIARHVDIPISAAGGVTSYKDVIEYIMCGATTVQFASAILWNGYGTITKIISDLNDWMDRKGYKSFDEIRGCILDEITTTEALAEEAPMHASIDEAACISCGRCAKSCAYRAISKGEASYVVDPDKCDGCGLCGNFCPKDAISLKFYE